MWECDASNFSWYCDQEDQEPTKAPTEKQPTPPTKPTSIKDAKTIEELRKELQRLLDVANMNPTPENVKAYMEAAQYMAGKASKFSDVWRRVLWASPDLDYSLNHRPTNNVGIRAYDTQRKANERGTIADLSRTHGLFFFFRGDCPYCHQMAPILRFFQQEYGMEVFPVSLDGGGLPEFPRPSRDNGMGARLGIDTVPAVFLASKTDGNVMPVAFGVVPATELAERIYVLTRTQPGDPY
jgi:conjugal transfer pilus assembly protein TraF